MGVIYVEVIYCLCQFYVDVSEFASLSQFCEKEAVWLAILVREADRKKAFLSSDNVRWQYSVITNFTETLPSNRALLGPATANRVSLRVFHLP
jgi:hypothetical protein